MGQKASSPSHPLHTQMQVLALGLPRTGTSSLSVALEALLGTPCFHGGAQMLASTLPHAWKWLELHRISVRAREAGRKETDDENARIKEIFQELLAGYGSVVDTPVFYYAQQLVELYPNAKVIVTIRNPDDWWKSKMFINRVMRSRWNSLITFSLPTGLRHFTTIGSLLLRGAYAERYFVNGERDAGPWLYERHLQYIKDVVPKERLFFYDIKDGWEPLCRILENDVPDRPFPRLNESQAVQAEYTRVIRLGYVWWAVWITLIAIVSGTVLQWMR